MSALSLCWISWVYLVGSGNGRAGWVPRCWLLFTLCRVAAGRNFGGHCMKPLPTWRYLVKMVRYKPRLYLLHAVLWGAYSMSWFLAGLLAQAFFNTLTGQTDLPIGTTG